MLSGISLLEDCQNFEYAKVEFMKCLNKPDGYIMTAICDKSLGNPLHAIQLIDDCIEKYPSCVDAYMFKS